MSNETDECRKSSMVAFEKWFDNELYPIDAQKFFMFEAWKASRADLLDALQHLRDTTPMVMQRKYIDEVLSKHRGK